MGIEVTPCRLTREKAVLGLYLACYYLYPEKPARAYELIVAAVKNFLSGKKVTNKSILFHGSETRSIVSLREDKEFGW